MDLHSLIKEFIDRNYHLEIARDPRMQFGAAPRAYLGATLLPNQLSDENSIVEDLVRYDIVIADDGDPYSPPQIKQSAGAQELVFRLGHIDIAAQMTPKDMKTLGRLMNGNDRSMAMEFMSRWLTRVVRLGCEEKAERQRWQAIADASVTITGKDSDTRTVSLQNPAGHRKTVPSGTVASPAGWYLDTYDPFIEDILPAKQFLAEKGYAVNRIITSTRILEGAMASNAKVLARTGGLIISGGQLSSPFTNAAPAALAAQFIAAGLPAPETYDLRYRTQTSTVPFLGEDKFVMVASTGRDQDLDLGDEGLRVVENTLGYYGVGVCVGQTQPGMVITPVFSERKPVGVYAEGYMEGFPILLDGEALVVLTIPKPTP